MAADMDREKMSRALTEPIALHSQHDATRSRRACRYDGLELWEMSVSKGGWSMMILMFGMSYTAKPCAHINLTNPCMCTRCHAAQRRVVCSARRGRLISGRFEMFDVPATCQS